MDNEANGSPAGRLLPESFAESFHDVHRFCSDWHFGGHEDALPRLSNRRATGLGFISQVQAVRSVSRIATHHSVERPPDTLGLLRP